MFEPQTKERANQKPRILICDGFGTHETLKILDFCFKNNIFLCRLPSHTSHKLQPCDVAVFSPLKAAHRDQVERLERGGVGAIGKQHFTYYTALRGKGHLLRETSLQHGKQAVYIPSIPARYLRMSQNQLNQLFQFFRLARLIVIHKMKYSKRQ